MPNQSQTKDLPRTSTHSDPDGLRQVVRTRPVVRPCYAVFVHWLADFHLGFFQWVGHPSAPCPRLVLFKIFI